MPTVHKRDADDDELYCPHCNTVVLEDDYACPNCRHVLKFPRPERRPEPPRADEDDA